MSSPEALLTLSLDGDGRIRDLDDAAERVLAWPAGALAGAPLTELIPSVALASGPMRFQAEVRTGHSHHLHAEVWVSALLGGCRTVMLREAAVDLGAELALFLGDLSDDLRARPDPDALLQAAVLRVGERFGVDRASFSRVGPDGETSTVAAAWTTGALGAFAPSRNLREVLGEDVFAGLSRGETFANADALADVRLAAEATERLAFRSVHGVCIAPLLWDGRLVATLALHTREPRDWSAAEVQAIEEAGRRTLEALERSEAEARLREGEERFRTFAEALPDLAFVMDAQGEVVWRNRRHDDYFGPGADLSIETVIHSDDRERVLTGWAQALASGEPMEHESRVLCGDGRYRPFRAFASPVRDASGRVLRWVGLSRDVSELRARERIQAFLLELGERLRSTSSPAEILRGGSQALGEFLGVTRVGYAQVDEADHQVVIENDWAAEGTAPLTGRHDYRDHFASMSAYRTGRTLAAPDYQALPGVGPEELESLRFAGIRGSITVPLLRQGRLAGVFSVTQDAPRDWTAAEVQLVEEVAERTWAAWERAGAEARLAASEAQFRGLAENLPNLCWISLPDGEVVWGNRRYREYYEERIAQGARIGESLTVHPDDRVASQGAWAQAYATGEPFAQMVRSRDAAGVYRPFLCQAEPVRDPAGRVVRWCGILTDLSEQQAREDRQRFLLELGEATRHESDPLVILRVTSERLGLHLAVDRVVYGEIEAATGDVVSPCDWAAPGLDSMAERRLRPTEDNWVIAGYRAGRTLACADHAELAGTTENFRTLHRGMGATAFITAPLVKEGRLHGLFSVYDRHRRDWSAEEVALVEEVGERTWQALSRARAEAASRESEEQFRTFAESLPDIAFVVDAAGAPLWWNGRHEELLGPGQGMAHVGVMCHPDEVERVMSSWGRSMSLGEPIYEECRLMCVDGRYRRFRAHASPVKTADGHVVRWCGLVADVTEQRERERAQAFLLELGDKLRRLSTPADVLRRASEELRGHLGADTVAFAEADETGEVVRIEFEARSGAIPATEGDIRLGEWAGEFLARFRAGEPAVLRDALAQVGADPVRGAYESSGVRATVSIPLVVDGAFRAVLYASQSEPRDWTESEVHVIREVAERTWAVIERARAEGAQRETEALLTAIMTNAPVGMYVKDLAGRYQLMNREMAKMIGGEVEDFLGRTAAETLDPELAAEVAQYDRRVLAEARPVVNERRMRPNPTEPYAWTLSTRFPVQITPGGPLQVAGINVDLTAQKRAEQQLDRSREALYQSEKLTALGSLLAGVSHELNNPLSIVVAQTVMLERQAGPGPLAERARHIRSAADRCARIVQTFLAMARQRQPQRRRTDLNAVVDAALELTAYGLRTSGVKVVREPANDLPALSADADQLHQVIINLVLNAQHALQVRPDGRVLILRTTALDGGDRVALEVIDNGPGIPEELRRRVFEPFFTTKPQDVGTGVGLSFSQGLVESHGGRLELADTPGGGATFRVVLPVGGDLAPDVAPRPPGNAAECDPARRAALVVDDEPQIARALAEFLEFEGYRCEVAFGGAEAKERLKGGVYDLILSDLRMPEVDGPALYAWIKAERPELAPRVAFATGDTLGPTAVRFLAREGRPFMEKPFTPDSLRALLDEVEALRPEPA